MSNRNFFYISMTRKEQLIGWLYLIFEITLLPYLLSAALMILFPESNATVLNLILFAVNFIVVAVIFRRYWLESFRDLSGRIWPILWKSVVALLGCRVVLTVMNDFIFFYCPQYFIFTDTGPVLQNINDAYIAQMAKEQYLLIAIGTILLVPPVEEILHRGVVFGSIYPKSPTLACIISVLLFAAVHMLSYLGIPDKVYLVICFLQYIPPALTLCWLYTGTDSIFAPILMHMMFNAIGIFSVR